MTIPAASDRRLETGGGQRLSILPWAPRKLDDLADSRYDLVLGSAGFEPRSIAIARGLATPQLGIAVGFPPRPGADYEPQRQWYDANDYRLSDDWGARFLPFVRRLFAETIHGDRPTHIAVDISSMERPRIAAVIQCLADLPPDVSVDVEILYAPAEYRPPEDLPSGALNLSCVSSYFAGSLQSASEPADPVALVGLGYEPFKAAGALTSLEVARSVAFIPHGFDDQFYDAVLRANEGLLQGPDHPERIEYEVREPVECFAAVEGQVHALRARGANPLIVPLGPKVFTACACMAAAVHHPHVTVWRASFLEYEEATPHEADGNVCGLTIGRRPAPEREG